MDDFKFVVQITARKQTYSWTPMSEAEAKEKAETSGRQGFWPKATGNTKREFVAPGMITSVVVVRKK